MRAYLPLLSRNPPTIDVAHMLLRNMSANATADTRTPIFYGGWNDKLFKNYIWRTPTVFNKGVGTTKFDLAVCRNMNLIIDLPDRSMGFKDASGRVWNLNDLDGILAIEDVQNHPRPEPFLGSSTQGGSNFPNLINLYNIMKETLQVSKNAYSLGQSSSSRIGSMERNIISMQNDITHIPHHMVIQDEEEEEEDGQNMDGGLLGYLSLLNLTVFPRLRPI
ncbi:hypothetical protein Hanom_Chr02g00118941 [Helianthus anomalus]